MKHLISKFLPFIKPQLDFDSVTKLNLKSLYRFTYFDDNNFYEDLLKNILYFSSKNQFNDPFDSQIPTKYKLCSGKELDQYLDNLLIKRGFDGDNSNKINIAKEKLKKNPQEIQNTIDNLIEKRVGILALTENYKNLLLWAHYSNKHTGFCVEIDAQLLNKIIKAEFIKNRELAFIFKVKYQNKFPIINPCKQSFEQRTKLQFLIKSEDWKYEKEWRILLLNGSRQKVELPKNVIKNIYFGLRSSDENINKSKKILKISNPEIGIFKAQKEEDKFSLSFKEI
ncbi:MAG: DUF2971 domain-containing protein [Ignavibacteriaceae bacterium]